MGKILSGWPLLKYLTIEDPVHEGNYIHMDFLTHCPQLKEVEVKTICGNWILDHIEENIQPSLMEKINLIAFTPGKSQGQKLSVKNVKGLTFVPSGLNFYASPGLFSQVSNLRHLSIHDIRAKNRFDFIQICINMGQKITQLGYWLSITTLELKNTSIADWKLFDLLDKSALTEIIFVEVSSDFSSKRLTEILPFCSNLRKFVLHSTRWKYHYSKRGMKIR